MNIFLEKFIKENFKTPATALDLGCGKGHDMAYLTHIGWSVKGIEKDGADLNTPYIAETKFDLVYSNYVLQFIDNKEIFIKTCYNNLKDGGWLFIHTFSKKDEVFKKQGVNKKKIKKLLNCYFHNIIIAEFKVHDHEPGHDHQHNILEITAQKLGGVK